MTTIDLHPEPLTAASFAPFGDVIEAGERSVTINSGAIEQFSDLVRLQYDADGRSQVSLACCNEPVTMPHRVTAMERHPHGSQAFIPLGSVPMYVVVALAGEAPTPQQLRAFVSNGQQGINYLTGVWHMPMIGLEAGQRWIVIDRNGPGNNCDLVPVDSEVILHGV